MTQQDAIRAMEQNGDYITGKTNKQDLELFNPAWSQLQNFMIVKGLWSCFNSHKYIKTLQRNLFLFCFCQLPHLLTSFLNKFLTRECKLKSSQLQFFTLPPAILCLFSTSSFTPHSDLLTTKINIDSHHKHVCAPTQKWTTLNFLPHWQG